MQAKRAAAKLPRAPTGANRAAVIRALEERPGATAGEIAAVAGVNAAVASRELTRLTADGTVTKSTLPTGRRGFRLRKAQTS